MTEFRVLSLMSSDRSFSRNHYFVQPIQRTMWFYFNMQKDHEERQFNNAYDNEITLLRRCNKSHNP
jgi:hypothetical protein